VFWALNVESGILVADCDCAATSKLWSTSPGERDHHQASIVLNHYELSNGRTAVTQATSFYHLPSGTNNNNEFIVAFWGSDFYQDQTENKDSTCRYISINIAVALGIAVALTVAEVAGTMLWRWFKHRRRSGRLFFDSVTDDGSHGTHNVL